MGICDLEEGVFFSNEDLNNVLFEILHKNFWSFIKNI